MKDLHELRKLMNPFIDKIIHLCDPIKKNELETYNVWLDSDEATVTALQALCIYLRKNKYHLTIADYLFVAVESTSGVLEVLTTVEVESEGYSNITFGSIKGRVLSDYSTDNLGVDEDLLPGHSRIARWLMNQSYTDEVLRKFASLRRGLRREH